MDKIEFTTADGTKCHGYLFTWEGLSFGLTKDGKSSCSGWTVFELQTGCSVLNKRLSSRKAAISEATELLNNKGVQTVKKRLKEIFIERGNTKVKGRIKTAHCALADNMLTTLCGRIKDQYCLPVKYFRYAKKPCKKCQRLVNRKKTGRRCTK